MKPNAQEEMVLRVLRVADILLKAKNLEELPRNPLEQNGNDLASKTPKNTKR